MKATIAAPVRIAFQLRLVFTIYALASDAILR
jgi:hypothetical protein